MGVRNRSAGHGISNHAAAGASPRPARRNKKRENKKQTRCQKEYFHQLYTYEEILQIIEKYGLPQDWNDDGAHGYERYIEAHVWSDETVGRYRGMSNDK